MKPATTITTQLKKLDHSYAKVLEHFKKKQVHQYRLKVKELKAFIALLNCAAKQPQKIKLPEALNDLYKHTGSIRNLQLQKQYILHFEFKGKDTCPISYVNFLAHEEQRWKDKARQPGHVFTPKKGKKLLSYIPRDLKKKHLKKFLARETEKIRNLFLAVHLKDEDFHQLRKILKGIFYNWSYVGAYAALLPPGLDDKKKIESLTVTLGNFQDQCIALHLLDVPFLLTISNEKEVQTLNDIKKQWNADKNNTKAELEKHIAAINTTPARFFPAPGTRYNFLSSK